MGNIETGLILLLLWCCVSGRCGCKVRFNEDNFQWGSVESDRPKKRFAEPLVS